MWWAVQVYSGGPGNTCGATGKARDTLNREFRASLRGPARQGYPPFQNLTNRLVRNLLAPHCEIPHSYEFGVLARQIYLVCAIQIPEGSTPLPSPTTVGSGKNERQSFWVSRMGAFPLIQARRTRSTW